ncbi:hypothetical protein LBMAG42_57610 [Deltaproteobacteria bacterium]|nr:hypothetical protein LBMAG42_57610 [Deltaproteobacteria bacterium]
MADWLLAEEAAVETLQRAGLDLGELPGLLKEALSSGLAEEAVVVPGEDVPAGP